MSEVHYGHTCMSGRPEDHGGRQDRESVSILSHTFHKWRLSYFLPVH